MTAVSYASRHVNSRTCYKRMYVTVYVGLNGLTREQYDAADDADKDAFYEEQRKLHDAAFALVEQRHTQVPGYQETHQDHEMQYEVPQWELCADDTGLDARGDKMCWSVCFYSEQKLKPQVWKALAQCVLDAYQEAAAGKPCELEDVEVQTVEETTQTSAVTFNPA